MGAGRVPGGLGVVRLFLVSPLVLRVVPAPARAVRTWPARIRAVRSRLGSTPVVLTSAVLTLAVLTPVVLTLVVLTRAGRVRPGLLWPGPLRELSVLGLVAVAGRGRSAVALAVVLLFRDVGRLGRKRDRLGVARPSPGRVARGLRSTVLLGGLRPAGPGLGWLALGELESSRWDPTARVLMPGRLGSVVRFRERRAGRLEAALRFPVARDRSGVERPCLGWGPRGPGRSGPGLLCLFPGRYRGLTGPGRFGPGWLWLPRAGVVLRLSRPGGSALRVRTGERSGPSYKKVVWPSFATRCGRSGGCGWVC
ncbi:hypothetical protein ACTI_02550 [Actinoplanes sp. OR16]|nr:hypothetical protein ACTI_02550 [Actinoplanes sp. OR16]